MQPKKRTDLTLAERFELEGIENMLNEAIRRKSVATAAMAEFEKRTGVCPRCHLCGARGTCGH